MRTEMQRRRFLTTLAAGFATVTLGDLARADDKSLPHLMPADPAATALHYVEDATAAASVPGYKKGSACSNCQQFQGKAADAYAGCTIFTGKSVKATGWCQVWVAKA